MISYRQNPRKITLPYMAYESSFGGNAPMKPLATDLGSDGSEAALRLFRSGLDTVDIASRLECTPAAAANAVARARDEERRAV